MNLKSVIEAANLLVDGVLSTSSLPNMSDQSTEVVDQSTEVDEQSTEVDDQSTRKLQEFPVKIMDIVPEFEASKEGGILKSYPVKLWELKPKKMLRLQESNEKFIAVRPFLRSRTVKLSNVGVGILLGNI